MGWQVVFVFKPLVHALPVTGILLLVCGWVFYTIGSIFYVWRRIRCHYLNLAFVCIDRGYLSLYFDPLLRRCNELRMRCTVLESPRGLSTNRMS